MDDKIVWKSCRFDREEKGKFGDINCEDVAQGCLFGQFSGQSKATKSWNHDPMEA